MFKYIRNILIVSLFVFPAISLAAHYNVAISGFLFSPDSLNIAIGDTVTWTNNHSFTHTSTSNSGIWNSGNLSQGQSFSYVFAAAGHFPYHCAIHPSMLGVIVVTELTGIGDNTDAPIPGSLGLTNFPNPFNLSTRVSFTLPQSGRITLGIYDLTGRLIKLLVNGYQSAGLNIINWDGADSHGNALSSGVYFIRLVTDFKSTTQRAVLLK